MRRGVLRSAASPSPTHPFGLGPPAPEIRQRVMSGARRPRAIRPAIVFCSLERRRGAAALAFAVLILLAPGLTGCGKKDLPTPPPGAPNTYPRSYPRE